MRKLNPGLLLFVLSGLLLLVACAPTGSARRTPAPVDLEGLLIDLSVFPSGWKVDMSIRSDQYEAVDNIYVAFRPTDAYGLAQQQVFLFPDERSASRSWKYEARGFSSSIVTPWETPAELPYESTVADQFSFICADIAGGPLGLQGVHTLCQAVGRYGKYVSTFSTWPSPEHMTWTDIERILQDIDRRMEARLATEGR